MLTLSLLSNFVKKICFFGSQFKEVQGQEAASVDDFLAGIVLLYQMATESVCNGPSGVCHRDSILITSFNPNHFPKAPTVIGLSFHFFRAYNEN